MTNPSQYSGGPSVDALELKLSGTTALEQDFKRTAAVEVTLRGEIVGHTFDDKKDSNGNVTATIKGIKLKCDELVAIEEVQRVRNSAPGQTAVNDDGQVFDPATGEILDDPVVDAEVVAELPPGDPDEPRSQQEPGDPAPEPEPEPDPPMCDQPDPSRPDVACVLPRGHDGHHVADGQAWDSFLPEPEETPAEAEAQMVTSDAGDAWCSEHGHEWEDWCPACIAARASRTEDEPEQERALGPEPGAAGLGAHAEGRQHSGGDLNGDVSDDGLIDGQIPRPVEPGAEYTETELLARRRYLAKRPLTDGPGAQAQQDELAYLNTLLAQFA